jgi:hypothetical protein
MCDVLKFPQGIQWGSNGIDIGCFLPRNSIFSDVPEYQVLCSLDEEYQKIVFLAPREKS